MPTHSRILIDSQHGIVDSNTVAGTHGWRAQLRTCRGGRSEGVQVVELDNGLLCLDVLPTRGMGIWRVHRRGSEDVLGWRSPAGGPVHPSFVPLMEPAGFGWLDGFSELLCRCGLESNGPPEFDDAGRLLRPLHGRIANLPAHLVELIVDEDARTLSLRGTVDEARFHFQSLRLTSTITTAFGSHEFTWTDEVTNIGGRPATLQLLYHFNLGQPLLRPGARIHAPLKTIAPHSQAAVEAGIDTWNQIPPPRPGSFEQTFLLDLAADSAGNTRVLVDQLTGGQAVALRFNKHSLPCFTVWRNTPAEADGFVLGIEPGTNYPNPRTFEQQQGRAVSLQPGDSWTASVSAAWLDKPEHIAQEAAAIAALQERHEPKRLTTKETKFTKI